MWFFDEFKFAYKTTKFYAKWLVRNFGQKHELQYLEKIVMYKWLFQIHRFRKNVFLSL